MAKQILQVNFRFNVSKSDYEKIVDPLAASFAAVPGCAWKIWLMNEQQNEAGGIYCFDDESSVDAFKASPLVAAVLSHPVLSDFQIKQFEALEAVSRVTRGPLAATASV